MCGKSYVYPRIPESYIDESLADAFTQARNARDFARRAVILLLIWSPEPAWSVDRAENP